MATICARGKDVCAGCMPITIRKISNDKDIACLAVLNLLISFFFFFFNSLGGMLYVVNFFTFRYFNLLFTASIGTWKTRSIDRDTLLHHSGTAVVLHGPTFHSASLYDHPFSSFGLLCDMCTK